MPRLVTLPSQAQSHVPSEVLERFEGGTPALTLPAGALAYIPEEALARVLEAFAKAGELESDLAAALQSGEAVTVSAAALAHIPAEALAKVLEALALRNAEVGAAADLDDADRSTLSEAVLSLLPQPALDRIPQELGGGGVSEWTLPEAALEHMSATAQDHLSGWLF